jgi:branched-chain amino acid transport system ATP-binding protein
MSLLQIEGVTQQFGGLLALDDVSFTATEGQITALIGPNGAGKTTLFNVVAGTYAPTHGRVLFDGEEITGRAPHVIARTGLARTFQLMKPFAALSVVDNVRVAALAKGMESQDATDKSHDILAKLGLADWADREAGTLPTGGRKRLELARALALDPKMLLLDEVLAGLTPGERGPVIDLLLEIRESGVTLLLVEHVMAAVMALSDTIIVLHHGQLLAKGAPDEVTNDPAVIEAYLGDPM